MKRVRTLVRAAVLVNAALLAAAFVAYRAGAFDSEGEGDPAPPGTAVDLSRAGSAPDRAVPPSVSIPEDTFTGKELMWTSKSGRIFSDAPAEDATEVDAGSAPPPVDGDDGTDGAR